MSHWVGLLTLNTTPPTVIRYGRKKLVRQIICHSVTNPVWVKSGYMRANIRVQLAYEGDRENG